MGIYYDVCIYDKAFLHFIQLVCSESVRLFFASFFFYYFFTF